jgi:hypothetical protein
MHTHIHACMHKSKPQFSPDDNPFLIYVPELLIFINFTQNSI